MSRAHATADESRSGWGDARGPGRTAPLPASRTVPAVPGVPAAGRPDARHGGAGHLLALQRSAGNAAVARLVHHAPPVQAGPSPVPSAPPPVLTVQRQDLGDSGGLHLSGGTPGASLASSTSSTTLSGFATGSAELTPEQQATLTGLAAQLNAEALIGGGFVTVVGYADRRGAADANRALGQQRADTAAAYLRDLVQDDDTRGEIRAYSMGAPEQGPQGDVPELRKIEVTITRRRLDLGPGSGLGSGGGALPSPVLPPAFAPLPGLWPGPGGPGGPYAPGPAIPNWARPVPGQPVQPAFLNQVSRWLNTSLGTHNLSAVAADVAGLFGADRTEVRRSLDEALISGTEAGLKELLRALVNAVAGPPSSPPRDPYGPPVREIPTPRVITSPEFHF